MKKTFCDICDVELKSGYGSDCDSKSSIKLVTSDPQAPAIKYDDICHACVNKLLAFIESERQAGFTSQKQSGSLIAEPPVGKEVRDVCEDERPDFKFKSATGKERNAIFSHIPGSGDKYFSEEFDAKITINKHMSGDFIAIDPSGRYDNCELIPVDSQEDDIFVDDSCDDLPF